LATKPPYL